MPIRLAGQLLLGAFLSASVLVGLSACTTQQAPAAAPGYLVFFSERSSAMEPTATDVVAHAAAAAQAQPALRVTVIGWTDSDGSPAADVALSQARAQRVSDALVADGVAPARITRQGRGQTGTDPGVESRRVEIRLGG